MMVCAVPGFAASISDNANSADYVIKAPAMILRGVGNAVLAPLEVVSHGYRGTVDGRPIVGTVEGVARGVYWCLDRALRGAWDVATALAPNYNGSPPVHELEFFGNATS